MDYGQRTPAVWTEQEHFAVSEKGAIKPFGDAYAGRGGVFLTLDAAKHIMNNLASFKEAIELSEKRTLVKEANKELSKMKVLFIRQGLTPDQAEAAVQAILANKQTA